MRQDLIAPEPPVTDTSSQGGLLVDDLPFGDLDHTLWLTAGPDGQRVTSRPRSQARGDAAIAAAAPGADRELTATLDADGVVVAVSDNCAALLGFEREELIGVRASDLVHPEEAKTLAPATNAFAQGLTEHLYSIQRVRHKHRGWTLMETTLHSRAGVPGRRPAGTALVARVPLETSETEHHPAVSLAPTAVGSAYAWVMRDSGRSVIASADPVFARLLGATTASVVGCPLNELTDPDDPHAGYERLMTLLDGTSTTYQVERSVAAGQVSVELTVSLLPLTDKPGQMAVIHARDVTRRRQIEQAVQASLAELERSNRELEAFASIAAHDLAAPLRVVVGYAELLSRQNEALDPGCTELLGKMASTSRRMQAQVDGLMMLARTEREAPSLSRCDSRSLVDEALDTLDEDIARRQATIRVGRLPEIECYETGLIQVFQNLVTNALKYGGFRPQIDISARPGVESWQFTVSDRGEGLPHGRPEELFDLFQRGRTDARGAGIGLAVSRRIVERHGGRIWCNQRTGGGAEFHFTIPNRNE